MKSHLLNFLIVVTMLACQSPTPTNEVATLILINGKIWTGNIANPEATAFAVKNDRILAVGTTTDILAYKGDQTEVIDAQNKFVTPGFIDCHVHFLAGGRNLASVQLRDAKTPELFSQRIADFAKTLNKGDWIMGGEWDHELWGGSLPDKEWIDKFTPDNPVFVRRLDGHMALSNSLALKLAGIDKATPAVEGGEIIRNATGEPTGVLKDNAMNIVREVTPPPSQEELAKALNAAMNYVAAQGVTTVHHVAGIEPKGYMEAFEKARADNTMITRIYAMMPLTNWRALKAKIEKEGNGDDWLKIGGLKGFIDGSLGSHTALFHEPYTDEPSDKGFMTNPPDSVLQWIKDADKAGMQVTVHAIGDEAIHFILNTFEEIQTENGAKDRRFRVEHAQHIAPADIPRFASLDVIPSMQPYHAIDDGRWAERLIGAERAKTSYAFKSLFDANAKVAFGSDWFVAPPTPLEGIYAAVTRQTIDGKNPNGWVPEQKITVEQALIGYTRNAAYASFDEDQKGSIEKGKLADFVIIDQDIRTIALEKIRDASVLATYVGGKKVFGADD